jgi:type I restriction enzyme R subunit
MKSEHQTRQAQIDRQLGRAGWSLGGRRVVEEYLIQSTSPLKETDKELNSPEFADYVLLDRLDRPLAIVEAKRSSRDALSGERQAADYADRLREQHGVDPFIFLANGNEIWFWHRRLYPPRKVSGFFTEDDLLRMAHLDRYGQPLAGVMPLEHIIDRAYQIEAVKTIVSVDSLRQPPFTAIGEPEKLFPPAVHRDMLDLTRQLAA